MVDYTLDLQSYKLFLTFINTTQLLLVVGCTGAYYNLRSRLRSGLQPVPTIIGARPRLNWPPTISLYLRRHVNTL